MRAVLISCVFLALLGGTVWAARGLEAGRHSRPPARIDTAIQQAEHGPRGEALGGGDPGEALFHRDLAPLFPDLTAESASRTTAPRGAGRPMLRTGNGVIPLDRPLPAGLARSPFASAGPTELLVRFDPGTASASAAIALRRAGARVLGPYGPDSFVVEVPGPDVTRAIAAQAPATRILPFGAELIVDRRIGQIPVLTPDEASSQVLPLRAGLFPGVDPGSVAADLTALGATIRGIDNSSGAIPVIRFTLDYDRILQVGDRVAGIFRIEEESAYLAADEEMSSTMEVGGFLNARLPFTDAGIDGSGGGLTGPQILAVTDTGLSYDALHFSDTFTSAGIPGPAHSKILSYTAVGTGDLLTCDDPSSGGSTHGNIVAGIAAGAVLRHGVDLRNNAGWDSGFSDHPADGVAPGAKVVFQDAQSATMCTTDFDTVAPGSLFDRMTEAHALGARVHNMSFSAFLSQGQYTLDSIDVDQFLRDNSDYMAVIAVGNEGSDFNGDGNFEYGSITAPATAKNSLGIGASNYPNEPINPFDPGLALTPGVPNDGVNLLSIFSEGSTGRGPATFPNRIKPDLMAPGQDLFPNLRVDGAAVCRSADDDNDSATGGVECILDDDNDGTSNAAAGVSGAALLVRDYFAQGFADDGAAGGPAVNSTISGAALKAVLIGSAEFMRVSPAFKFALVQPRFDVPDHLGRFNPEQGYGRVNLTNILPLNSDADTPSGLIVVDDGLSGGLQQGGVFTTQVTVLDPTQELRTVLAWMDPPDLSATGALINDLDLEVVDPGVDGIVGSLDDVLYRGNFFTEDQGDYDGRLRLADPNLPSIPGEDSNGNFVLDESAFSLPVFTAIRNYHDVDNPNEAVFLSPDPDGDGDTSDSQLTAGRQYTVRVIAQRVSSPFETIITAGANAVIDSVPAGDDGVGSAGDTITAGPDGLADTLAAGDDVQVVAVGSSAPQPFALVMGGGITASSSLRLNASEYLCNDLLTTTVLDPSSGLLPAAVSSAVTIEVRAPGGALMDSENAAVFSQPDPGSGRFVSDALAVIDGVIPVNDDGILSVQDGASLKAIYIDADGPQVESLGTVSCSASLDLATISVPGANQSFNVTGGCDPARRRDPRGILIGFNENPPGDLFLDAGERVTYSVSFLNQELDADLIDAVATLKAFVPTDSPDMACQGQPADEPGPCKKISILNPSRDIGLVPRGTLQAVSFDVVVEPDVVFPEQIDMKFSISARRNGLPVGTTPSMGGVEVVFRHTLDMDMESLRYSTDFPTGGSQIVIYAGELFDPLNPDIPPELFTFADATDTSFGGGNPQWDPNSPGPRAPWTFDLDNEGFTTARRFDSSPGLNQQLNLNLWHWMNTGECGFQSNEGVCTAGFNVGNACGTDAECINGIDDGTCSQIDGQGGAGGIWHTGTIGLNAPEPARQPANGRDGFDLGCEDFDVPSDPGTPTNESVLDVLSSPIFHRVHVSPDANGFAYTLEFARLGFNAQVDTADANVIIGWELDPDTTTPSPVDPLDFGSLNFINSARGFLSGISQIPFPTFDPNNPHDPGSFDGTGPQGPGSVGSFFDTNDPAKAPARRLGEVGGTGFGTIQERGAGGLPLRNFEEILDGFYGGDTAFEDIFGPNENNLAVPPIRRDDFQVNFSMLVKENSDPTIQTIASYGIGIDDVVVEWRESHPVADASPCVTVNPSDPGALGGCGRISWDRAIVYESEEAVVLTIQDPDAFVGPDGIPGTGDEQAVDSNMDGFFEIKARVFSDVDLIGEEVTLIQTSFASPSFETAVQLSSTTGLNSDTDGVIFIQQNGDGSVPVVVTAQYNDQDDGTGQPCVSNPVKTTLSTQFVGGNILFVSARVQDLNGDLDGLPDDNEKVRLDIAVVSNMLDSADNPVTLNNTRIFLSSVDPDVACITDNVADYGTLVPGAAATNPPGDGFEFVVGNVDRTFGGDLIRASFSLGLTGTFTDISGQLRQVSSFATPQQFDLNLDLDLAGTTSVAPDFVENWDAAPGGDGVNSFVTGPVFPVNDATTVDGSRCQFNDPGGPNPLGGGRSLAFCRPWDGSDWHVHSLLTEGFVTPKAFSGDAALLMGTHEAGLDSSFDSYTTSQLSFAESPILNIGLSGGANLSFRQIVAFADDRTFNVPSGEAADRAVVQVAQVNSAGTPISAWQNIPAFQNNYANQGTGSFINCKFDPVDDAYDTFGAIPTADPTLAQNIDGVSTEDDYFDPNDPDRTLGPSSTCFPEFVFAFMGDWTSNNPMDSGQAFVPGAPGATGSGIWVESIFSLDPFAGQTIRVRLMFAGLELNGPAGNTWAQFFGNQLGNATRGWLVDDFRVTGLIDAPATLIADTKTPPLAACPADPDPTTPANEAACTVASAVAGPDVVSPAPGFLVTFDGSASLLDSCVDGFIEYRWRQGGEIVQDWSNKPNFRDNPVFSSAYFLDVRCSVDPACTDTQMVQVTIGGNLREVSQGGSQSPPLTVTPAPVIAEGIAGNGIADTVADAASDDVQEIAVGLAASPGAVIVSSGPDGLLQTVPAPDDVLDAQRVVLDWENIGTGLGYDVQRVDIEAFDPIPLREDAAAVPLATLPSTRLCRLGVTPDGVITLVENGQVLTMDQVIGYLVNGRRVSDSVPGSLGAGMAGEGVRVPRPAPPSTSCP
ncbi:MAG: S8 family serine peptidase [Acidobacteriota bacterium]